MENLNLTQNIESITKLFLVAKEYGYIFRDLDLSELIEDIRCFLLDNFNESIIENIEGTCWGNESNRVLSYSLPILGNNSVNGELYINDNFRNETDDNETSTVVEHLDIDLDGTFYLCYAKL